MSIFDRSALNIPSGKILNKNCESLYSGDKLFANLLKADFHFGRNWVATGRNDIAR